jgi:hypothetical protein
LTPLAASKAQSRQEDWFAGIKIKPPLARGRIKGGVITYNVLWPDLFPVFSPYAIKKKRLPAHLLKFANLRFFLWVSFPPHIISEYYRPRLLGVLGYVGEPQCIRKGGK